MPTNIINRAAINFIVSYSFSKSPPEPSSTIYFNFITDFSKSITPDSVKYNSILILINCFIKLIYYYLVCKIINTI